MPLPVQALVTGRSISVMTGSMVDDFMTAAPTLCMSGDYMTAAPTTIGDLESSVPTLVRDRVANTEDFEDDSDTAAEEDTELVFESESSADEESSSDSDSSEGYPAGPLLPPYPLSQVARVALWNGCVLLHHGVFRSTDLE